MGNDCGPDRHPTSPTKRAKNLKLVLCAFALGTLLASFASAQVVEGYIQLPDTFGVFPAPYRVAWDFTPGEERLFIGGDSSDVLVIDAVNLRKLARIPTGPVGPLCFSPAQNKLYAAPRGGNSLYVVDCNTYLISRQVQLGERPSGLFYNPVVDRVYCSTSHMKVLDCSGDTVVGTIAGVGTGITTFDSTHNKLYVGASTALKVVDCYADSLIAAAPGVRGATAICHNSFSSRVYAAVGETTYALDVLTDTVVGQSVLMHQTLHTLRCDPSRNRVYAASSLSVVAWDCGADTMLWGRRFAMDPEDGPRGLACVPDLDRVYVVLPLSVPSFEGNTGNLAGSAPVDGRAAPPVYLDRLNRLYCLANWGQLVAVDCGIDTAMSQVPLDAFVDGSEDRVCLDTVQNKLYFAFNMPCGYVGVVDCSTRLVKSYQMCRRPGTMVHDPRDDKLYVSTWNGSDSGWVSVFNCRSDSLVKVIPTGYAKGGLRWHPQFNKVYSGVVDSLGYYHVVVIDCATDRVVRMLARDRQDEEFHYSLLSTESNQFWGISPHGYTVVDCLSDSIVMDTIIDTWSPWGVCYSGEDRKVYAIRGSMPRELVVLSMKSLRPIKSVPFCRGTPEVVLSVPSAHKIYVAVLTPMSSTTDSVYVVDTRLDSIISKFEAGHIIRAMCGDATGRYVYCTALKDHGSYVWSETLLVIDTQCDSIVSGTGLPGLAVGGGEWLLPNRRTGFMYAGQDENGKLLVIRDSVVVSVEEWRDVVDAPVPRQTVTNRAVPFRSARQADVYDATGRRAAILRSGSNDISHLSPGVYFVGEGLGDRGQGPGRIRKVIVTR